VDFHTFLQLEAMNRDTIDVKRIYIDMAGDLVAGVMLSQIVSLFMTDERIVRRDGRLWLAIRDVDWWDECRISPKQARRARNTLQQRGLIDVAVYQFNGTPTTHITLQTEPSEGTPHEQR